MARRFSFWFCCLVILARIIVLVAESAANQDDKSLEPWQTCQIFMAPSKEGMGWGVFAGRSFHEGEIVEMSPGIIPMEQYAPALVTSALYDYVYGYHRLVYPKAGTTNGRLSIHPMYAVMLGMGMVYNHHPESPNVEYTTFGREPAPDVPNTANSIGFKALRDIAAGEELFSTYGQEDGGKVWFERRNIPLQNPTKDQRRILPDDLSEAKAKYCSKLSAGMGQPTWRERVLPILPPPQHVPFWMDSQWLPPWDAEIGSAVAKVRVTQGERIELGIGMIVSQRRHLEGTPLAAVSFSWKELQPDEHQTALKTLRKQGRLKLQYNEFETESTWERTDGFAYWADIAIVPFGGSIGLVGRTTDHDTNCKLVIPTNDTLADAHGVVVAIELIATRDINVGEVIRLDLPPSGTAKEDALLRKELQLMGRIPHKDSQFYWKHESGREEL